MRISARPDVARATHRACAVDAAGRALLDRAMENRPEGIAAVAADLRRRGGGPVIGLDVAGSVARFPGASLPAEGVRLVHAPGIAVNRAVQGLAGGGHGSDPRDAHPIADRVRSRGLRPILPDDGTVTAIRRGGRLRGLLTRHVTPAGIRQAGRRAGWRRTRGGDKALGRTVCQGAVCAVCTGDPLSQAVHDRNRGEGKHHARAPVAPAHRRATALRTTTQRRQTCEPLVEAA